MKRLFLILAAADVLFFGGWIAAQEIARGGDQLKLPVEGFDPRDLLSGHYIRFRLVAEREAGPLGGSVFCLDVGKDGLVHVTRERGTSGCQPWLAGTRVGDRITFGLDRFFVDERRAASVTWVRAGPRTYLLATVDGHGRVHAIDLLVDGVSVGRQP